jgi:membrane fusion protein, multidrug efflux system
MATTQEPAAAAQQDLPERPETGRTRLTAWQIAGRVIAAALLLAVAVGVYRFWQYSKTYEQTDDAQIDSHMNIISTRIPGTVLKVLVAENQTVEAGQSLIELDPADYQLAVQRQKESLAQAQAQIRVEAPAVSITASTTETRILTGKDSVSGAEAGLAAARRDLDAQQARIAQAEAQAALAQAELARYETLVKKDQVSRIEYDEKAAGAKSASAALEAARAAADGIRQVIRQREATLAAANTELSESRRIGPQQVSVQHAALDFRNAGAQAARTALEEAALNLSYTHITAPVAGVIGKKNVEPGQRIQPGQQLMAIVPLNDIWVTANFKETQLKTMTAGQRATIRVDAYDKDYEGYVESLPPATAAKFSILPPENASGNYVRVVQRLGVKLRFKPGQDPEHRLRPGMSVTPKVWIH